MSERKSEKADKKADVKAEITATSTESIVNATTMHNVILMHCDISLPVQAQPFLMQVYEHFNKFKNALNKTTIS